MNVPDETLLEWYVTKKNKKGSNKMTPLACLRQTVNYQYGGAKVNANALIELSTTNSKQFFTKRCRAKEQTDREQFAIHEKEYDANKRGGGGIFGGIFGRRPGR